MPKLIQLHKEFLLIIFLVTGNVYAEEINRLENKVKALYLLRLGEFVAWPESVIKDTFNICIEQSDPIYVYLQKVEQQQINGVQLQILDVSLVQSLAQCHEYYISDGILLNKSIPRSVLTVSSQEGFASRGGLIEFYRSDNKVKMKANIEAINKSGIYISSKLKRLMSIETIFYN